MRELIAMSALFSVAVLGLSLCPFAQMKQWITDRRRALSRWPAAFECFFQALNVFQVQLACGHVVVNHHCPGSSCPEPSICGSCEPSSEKWQRARADFESHVFHSRPARARNQAPEVPVLPRKAPIERQAA